MADFNLSDKINVYLVITLRVDGNDVNLLNCFGIIACSCSIKRQNKNWYDLRMARGSASKLELDLQEESCFPECAYLDQKLCVLSFSLL